MSEEYPESGMDTGTDAGTPGERTTPGEVVTFGTVVVAPALGTPVGPTVTPFSSRGDPVSTPGPRGSTMG